MVEDTDPHIIGITGSWANNDISDAELELNGYVMFRKDRIRRRGGGVILYFKEAIQAYELKLDKEADCKEAVWCNIVTGKATLTVGLVYRSPNISKEENEKNAHSHKGSEQTGLHYNGGFEPCTYTVDIFSEIGRAHV